MTWLLLLLLLLSGPGEEERKEGVNRRTDELIIHLKPSASNRLYREANKGLYVVARNFFLLLLNYSAWPCLGPA